MNASIYYIVENLGKVLTKRKLSLTTAESCTGGGIAYAITAVPKCSTWFERSFITYSNLAKIQMLKINPLILQTYGAVSERVAYAMAEGALKNSAANISLAVTGITGPDSDESGKPVGLVWFAWAGECFITSANCRYFAGNRSEIIQQAINYSLKNLLEKLEK